MPELETKTNSTDFAPTDEDFLSQLVGEDKKYKTVEDLAKGAFHAQTHIKNLEKERDEDRKRLEQARTIDDVLSAVDLQRQSSISSPSISPNPQGQRTQEATPPAGEPISKNDIEETVRSLLQETKTEQIKQDNFNRAVEALDAKFGSREATNQAVQSRAQELGVGVEWLKDAAQASPDAFLSLMEATGGTQSQPNTSVAGKGSITSQAINISSQGEAPEGTYRYYQALKKSNPKQYNRIYSTIMKKAMEDPDAFYERT